MSILALAVVATLSAQAQTYRVLHNFTGGADGGYPEAGLNIDAAGNLYGTTAYYGLGGAGVAFKLTHVGSDWIDTTLYNFSAYDDAGDPHARMTFGPDGSLYGTTVYGGGGSCLGLFGGCGAVFRLKPGVSACRGRLCGWAGMVLYGFRDSPDGAYPFAEMIFDQAGNLYGTTSYGGSGYCLGYGCGTVFKLTPSPTGWIESILYNFSGGADGALPFAGLILDRAGNLYGTTSGYDSNTSGTVFELTSSGINILHTFEGGDDGSTPYAGLLLDSAGNLYGATGGGGGTVFELSPSGSGWMYTRLYNFAPILGQGPTEGLTMDSAGNLYGTTQADGTYGHGSVFKLAPSCGGWLYTDLHDFTGGSDGGSPSSKVVFDANGDLYGTASDGGAYGEGVIWEITPQANRQSLTAPRVEHRAPVLSLTSQN